MTHWRVLTILIYGVLGQLSPGESNLLTDDCLRCICAASSDCQPNARCRIIEPDTYLCGPFRLSENYWLTAGMLTPPSVRRNSPLAFESCAHDLECSIKSVVQLVNSFVERCHLKYSRWDEETKCTLAAFVHYRAVYGNDEIKADEAETTSDDIPSSVFSCDVNSSNIEEYVRDLYNNAPATRSDDNYWSQFEECTQTALSAMAR